MKVSPRPNRCRSIALLLTGVLPLAVQPGAIAGQISALRFVDSVVADLPGSYSFDEFLRLLDEAADGRHESDEPTSLPEDVVAVILQCRLFSLIFDSAALKVPTIDQSTNSVGAGHGPLIDAEADVLMGHFAVRVIFDQPIVRRLSDEQPLGP